MKLDRAQLPHRFADLCVALALAGWWWSARGLPEFVLPGPWPVAQRLFALFAEPAFLAHSLASLWRVLLSVAIALLLGGALALIERGVPALDYVIRGGIAPFLNSFPSIGWAILAAIWFEPGHFSIVFVQVAILTPFCLINIAQGLRALDPELMEFARTYTRHRARGFLLVTLPLMMPFVLGALRIAYGIAWKISLVAELLGSTDGLGYLMLQAQSAADLTTVLAACFAIILLFVAGERLVLDPLARRFIR